MGKILNTTYQETVDGITTFQNNLIKNPFYQWTNLKPTKCAAYYNINKSFSSLDPGSKVAYDNIGSDSPLRFNRIYDLFIYDFDRIEVNMELDEMGLEADKIEGDCYLMPNMFVPTEGDYFEVDHIKDQTWLFIVKDVQRDTLDNGANVYKLSYKLEYNTNLNIQDHVVQNYRAIEVREGTNIESIVRCEDYDIAKLMDEKAVMLKTYFSNLFYLPCVQTFIFKSLPYDFRIYDPFLIEFLIRNKILDNGEDSHYIHVCHMLEPKATFDIDYDDTFFRCFEKKQLDKLILSNRYAELSDIKAYGSIFAGRYETYYKLDYIPCSNGTIGLHNLCALRDELIYQAMDHRLEKEVNEDINETKPEIWKNIIIKYFYDEPLTTAELDSLDGLRFEESVLAFYMIPLLIFCLEKYIEKTLRT